jgi:hypothetical protein
MLGAKYPSAVNNLSYEIAAMIDSKARKNKNDLALLLLLQL